MNGATTFGLFAVVLWLVGFVGWVLNITKIVGMIGSSFDTVAVELIVRCIGVLFAPLGAVLGFF